MLKDNRGSWLVGGLHQTKRFVRGLVALGLLMQGAGHAKADYIFTTFDVPGALGTIASGINDSGQIVGSYLTAGNFSHGFVLSGGNYTTIEITDPSPHITVATSINNAGQIAGWYTGYRPSFGGEAGFLLSGGSVTSFAVPSPVPTRTFNTQIYGLNSLGQIVGWYDVPESVGVQTRHGFLYSNGSYTTLDVPGSALTAARGINNSSQIVGSYTGNGSAPHGFLLSNGTYTTLDLSYANAINDLDQIVGTSGPDGFILSDGNLTLVDVPSAIQTAPLGINNLGDIVGGYLDAKGILHGFLATPTPEPSTLLLLLIGTPGIIGWAWWRRLTAA